MKIVSTKIEAKEKIISGINKVANAVKLTIGPAGTNAIIGRSYQSPLITNDGITIAKEFELEDELEQLGVQIVQEALKSANDIAGDGTTTTTVLLQAILNECKDRFLDPKSFTKSKHPMQLRKEIQEACAEIVSHLQGKKISTKEDIARVASISVESKEIGDIIASVFSELGKDALITVQDGFNKKIETETVLGIDVEGGLMNQYFANQDKKYVEEYPYIYITNNPISTIKDIESMIQNVLNKGKKSFILVAEHFDKAMLDLMLHNKITGQFTIIPIKAPTSDKSYILKDLCASFGVDFVDKDIGMPEEPATCNKVIITEQKTLFLGTKGDTKEYIAQLQEDEKQADSLYDKDKIKKRVQKLSGGIGIIRVDAQTETEKEYLKLKIEDAINATRCALEEGVVKGGGLALKEISGIIPSNILATAIVAPYNQIQENAGGIEIGEDVIDPVKVTRTSLEKACSIASMVLTTEIAINNKHEEKRDYKEE